jgi:hypothetical protein
MGDSSRIAALLTAWAFVGLTGCAKGPETQGEEATSEASAAQDDSHLTDQGLLADEVPRLDRLEPVDRADVARPNAPVTLRPPLCRGGAHLRSVAGGFICIGPGQFSPRPFCKTGWDLIRRDKGFMCKELVVRGPRGPLTPLEE